MSLARLQRAGLNPRFPGRVAETSFVHQIFGGYLRSQVMCPACKYKSNTYDPFLDLSLGLGNGGTSVTKALKTFTVRHPPPPPSPTPAVCFWLCYRSAAYVGTGPGGGRRLLSGCESARSGGAQHARSRFAQPSS